MTFELSLRRPLTEFPTFFRSLPRSPRTWRHCNHNVCGLRSSRGLHHWRSREPPHPSWLPQVPPCATLFDFGVFSRVLGISSALPECCVLRLRLSLLIASSLLPGVRCANFQDLVTPGPLEEMKRVKLTDRWIRLQLARSLVDVRPLLCTPCFSVRRREL